MKMQASFFCLGVALGISFAGSALAGVCFVVGDCGEGQQVSARCSGNTADFPYKTGSVVRTTCGAFSHNLTIGEELVGVGKICYADGKDYYSAWDCNKKDYPYIRDPNEEKYTYTAKTCCADGTFRYKNKICSDSYRYVREASLRYYNSSVHNPVQVCASPTGDTCKETNNLNGSPVPLSYLRYKDCTCPAGSNYSKCNRAHEHPAEGSLQCIDENGDRLYMTCICDTNYTLNNQGICVPVTGGFDKPDDDYVAYYDGVPDDKDKETILEAWRAWGIDKGVRVDVKFINHDEYSDKMYASIASGAFADYFEIVAHPLISMDPIGGVYFINLGLDVPDGGVNANIPFLMTGAIYDASVYENLCKGGGDAEPLVEFNGGTDRDSGVDYLGNMNVLLANHNVVETGIYSGFGDSSGKNCNPQSFDHDYNEAFNHGDEVNAWGGDKCVNYVLLNQKLIYPAAVYIKGDDGNGNVEMLYMFKNGGNRYYVADDADGSGKWKGLAENYNDPFGDNREHTDWKSNFLTWNIWNDSFALRSANTYDQVCLDKRSDYYDDGNGVDLFHKDDINTYPFMHTAWGADVDYDKFTEETMGDTSIFDNYVGNNWLEDMQEMLVDYPDKREWIYRKYYQENFESIVNGKNDWSYPWLDHSYLGNTGHSY